MSKYLIAGCYREQLKKSNIIKKNSSSLSTKFFLSKSYYTADMKSERSPSGEKKHPLTYTSTSTPASHRRRIPATDKLLKTAAKTSVENLLRKYLSFYGIPWRSIG